VVCTTHVFIYIYIYVHVFIDHQKLEREARICRLLKHPNIGEPLRSNYFTVAIFLLEF